MLFKAIFSTKCYSLCYYVTTTVSNNSVINYSLFLKVENMNTFYTISYVLKNDIPENGKFEADTIKTYVLRASDATRAISAFKNTLLEDKTIEAKGDVKVLEARIGF